MVSIDNNVESSYTTDNSRKDDNVIVTDTSYTSDSISVTINTMREYNTDIYVAYVVIKDISYLHAGLANGVFGKNITAKTSQITLSDF